MSANAAGQQREVVLGPPQRRRHLADPAARALAGLFALGMLIVAGFWLSFQGPDTEMLGVSSTAMKWTGVGLGLGTAALALLLLLVMWAPSSGSRIGPNGVVVRRRGREVRIGWPAVDRLTLHVPAGSTRATLVAAWLRDGDIERLPAAVRTGQAPLWLGRLDRASPPAEESVRALRRWAGPAFTFDEPPAF